MIRLTEQRKRNEMKRAHTSIWIGAAFVIFVLMPPVCCWAQTPAHPVIASDRDVQLMIGQSTVLRSPQPVKRVSVANPETAEFVLLSPVEVYLTGKTAGSTNITLWYADGSLDVYPVEVSYDVVTLKRRLHEVLPDEKDIRVFSAHDSITLSGRVSSTQNLAQAVDLAQGFSPQGKIRNLLEVAGIQQVMLEMRVSEISRSLMKRLGVNFEYTKGGEFGLGLPGKLAELVRPEQGNLPIFDGRNPALFVSPTVNALFRLQSGRATWTGFIDALREDGLIKVLAEPTLITMSGQEANFLVGGEYPIPVPQGLGTVAIEYKEFGVRLRFTPTVLTEKKISLKVRPEVSELDFTTAIRFEGFVVPGLTTRKAETVVELADGQSFAIAGLLRDTIRDSASKYPFLGDVPVLGNLFRSRSFQKNETELIIIATPHLVIPVDQQKQSLPTDFYVEPNDVDYFIWGTMEGRQSAQAPPPRAELDGDFGHAIPLSQ